jgi:antitoxin (DNA-binding transcriptional repressor) of toxin-antitoxin stability system
MKHLPINEAARDFVGIIKEIANTGEEIILTENSRNVARIIPEPKDPSKAVDKKMEVSDASFKFSRHYDPSSPDVHARRKRLFEAINRGHSEKSADALRRLNQSYCAPSRPA